MTTTNTKKNRHVYTGTCERCGTKKFRFIIQDSGGVPKRNKNSKRFSKSKNSKSKIWG